MTEYETLLDRDFDWALLEASRYFECANAVHATLQGFTSRLDEIEVDYAVVGAIAMFFHGYRRFTEDVDVIVTSTGLERIEKQLLDHHYIRETSRRFRLRDPITGVRIDLIVAGQRIGSGRFPEAIVPDPAAASEKRNGVKVLTLPRLLELKLFTGKDPARLRHVGDAQEMIRVLDLTREFREQIHPSLREWYDELWSGAQRAKQDDY